MIPQDVMEDILRHVSIVQVISKHVSLKKSGTNYKGLCPFHNDKNNPSLSVSEEKGLYHCFSCGAGGNALTFLKEYEKMDFIDAMKELGNMVGIDVEEYLKSNQDSLPLRSRLKTMHQIAQEFFIEQLYQFKDPGSRFAVNNIKNRKLDKNHIELFGLGYGGSDRDGLFKKLQQQGFKPDEILLSGLCGKSDQGHYYDRFRNRITFPVQDSDGTVIAFGGRALDPQAPAKYINSPETPLFKKGNVLYGWNFAKENVAETGEVILVEGYMDVIRMFQAGFCNTVAPLGTGLTEDRIAFLKHKTDRIILCFDGDDAGQKSTFRSLGISAKITVPAFVIPLPKEDDPDTFLLSQGPNAFASLLEKTISGQDFILQTAQQHLPDSQKFLNVVFEYAAHLEGNGASQTLTIATEQFLKHVSEILLVSFSSIELEFKKFKNLYFKYENYNSIPEEHFHDTDPKDQSAYEILAILILYPEFLDYVAELLDAEDFSNIEMQKFYKEFLLHPERTSNEWVLLAGNTPYIKNIGKYIEAPDVRIIKNHAVRIKLNSLKNQRDLISSQILQQEKNEEKITELQQKLLEIQQKMIILKKEFYFL